MKTFTKSYILIASLFCFFSISSLQAVWVSGAQLESIVGVESATQIAVDPNGNAVAVWVRTPNLGTATVGSATMLFGASWNTIPVTQGTSPSVAVDASGNAVLVYLSNPNQFIQAETLAFGGNSWNFVTTGLPLTTNNSSPHVAVDPAGNAVAVWLDSTGVLKAATLAFGANFWNVITTGLPITTGNTSPQIGVDSSGNAVLVWLDSTGTVQSASLPFLDTTWHQSLLPLSTPGSSSPQLAVAS